MIPSRVVRGGLTLTLRKDLESRMLAAWVPGKEHCREENKVCRLRGTWTGQSPVRWLVWLIPREGQRTRSQGSEGDAGQGPGKQLTVVAGEEFTYRAL